VPQSEYIAGWVGANTTPIANTGISPEGVSNATSITFASGGYWYQAISLSYTAGQTFVWSIYANTSTRVIQWGGATPAGTTTYEVIDSGNGWYRQILTRTMSGSGTGQFQTLMDSVYIGVGVEFKVFGAQLEAGSYATSYIPTYGSAVTRNADAALKTGISSLIGQTEGTMYVDVNLSARDSYTYFALAPNLGSSSAYIGIGITATAFSFEVVNSGVQVAYNYSNSSTGNFKMAFAYKENDFVAYVNGVQVMTDTSGSIPACSQIGLSNYDKDQPLLYKQALLFKTRLSNEELATLTTI
jgi:hypothetical protein